MFVYVWAEGAIREETGGARRMEHIVLGLCKRGELGDATECCNAPVWRVLVTLVTLLPPTAPECHGARAGLKPPSPIGPSHW